MKNISAEDLGGLLFGIHHHAGNVVDPDRIVYYEEDIVELLKLLGYPEPVWGKALNLKEYKQ